MIIAQLQEDGTQLKTSLKTISSGHPLPHNQSWEVEDNYKQILSSPSIHRPSIDTTGH